MKMHREFNGTTDRIDYGETWKHVPPPVTFYFSCFAGSDGLMHWQDYTLDTDTGWVNKKSQWTGHLFNGQQFETKQG